MVPGSVVAGVLLLALRLAGLAPLTASGAAVLAGLAVAVAVSRRAAGQRADLGMTATLTFAYSLLTGVLVTFLLAVLGVS